MQVKATSHGRLTKYTPETRARVLKCLRRGMPLVLAAKASELSPQTIANWRDRHPEFEAEVQTAIARGIEARLAVVLKATASKDESVALRAATWWLTHTPGAAEHYGANRLELSGPNGGPLTGAIGIFLPKKDGEAIEVAAEVEDDG
jgi:transposase-like protein